MLIGPKIVRAVETHAVFIRMKFMLRVSGHNAHGHVPLPLGHGEARVRLVMLVRGLVEQLNGSVPTRVSMVPGQTALL